MVLEEGGKLLRYNFRGFPGRVPRSEVFLHPKNTFFGEMLRPRRGGCAARRPLTTDHKKFCITVRYPREHSTSGVIPPAGTSGARNTKISSLNPLDYCSGASPPAADSDEALDEADKASALDDEPNGATDDSETETQDDEEHESGEDDTCDFRPARLHTTTSRHDDWLHRGPFLKPMPLHIYMAQVERIR